MKRYQNQLIIGVDTGNFNTKTQTACFTSGYTELAGDEMRFEDMLEFEGRHFALSGSRRPVRDDKTANEDFFLLTLFAIGKELVQHKISPGSYSIVLAVGLPPGHLSVKDLKRRTQDYYKRQAVFTYNKNRYQIDVSRVIVCPQGYAALLANTMTERSIVGIASSTRTLPASPGLWICRLMISSIRMRCTPAANAGSASISMPLTLTAIEASPVASTMCRRSRTASPSAALSARPRMISLI